jgi:hypothetical protein
MLVLPMYLGLCTEGIDCRLFSAELIFRIANYAHPTLAFTGINETAFTYRDVWDPSKLTTVGQHSAA